MDEQQWRMQQAIKIAQLANRMSQLYTLDFRQDQCHEYKDTQQRYLWETHVYNMGPGNEGERRRG